MIIIRTIMLTMIGMVALMGCTSTLQVAEEVNLSGPDLREVQSLPVYVLFNRINKKYVRFGWHIQGRGLSFDGAGTCIYLGNHQYLTPHHVVGSGQDSVWIRGVHTRISILDEGAQGPNMLNPNVHWYGVGDWTRFKTLDPVPQRTGDDESHRSVFFQSVPVNVGDHVFIVGFPTSELQKKLNAINAQTSIKGIVTNLTGTVIETVVVKPPPLWFNPPKEYWYLKKVEGDWDGMSGGLIVKRVNGKYHAIGMMIGYKTGVDIGLKLTPSLISHG